MKATISATGNLKITPENELESWALAVWFEAYTQISPRRATLSVEDIILVPKRDDIGDESK